MATEEMAAKFQDYAQKAIAAQQEITDRQRKFSDDRRGMMASEFDKLGMDYQAWALQKQGADEYYRSAQDAFEEGQKALAAGDAATANLKFDEAKKYADTASEAYKGLHRDIKDGDKTLITSTTTLGISLENMKNASDIAQEAAKAQADAAANGMNDLIKKFSLDSLTVKMSDLEKSWTNQWLNMQQEAGKNLDGVQEHLVGIATTVSSELKDPWLRDWAEMQRAAGTQIDIVDKALLDLTSKERTVWVNVKERGVLGSSIDAAINQNSSPNTAPRTYHLGGLIQAFQAGGPVFSAWKVFAGGGHLPGYGGGDRIPALLEAGEFVMRKEAVARIGANLLAQMNRAGAARFAEGGAAGQGTGARSQGTGKTVVLDLRSDGRWNASGGGAETFLAQIEAAMGRA